MLSVFRCALAVCTAIVLAYGCAHITSVHFDTVETLREKAIKAAIKATRPQVEEHVE